MIRVGLLGYGMAGRVFHAPLIGAEPRMRLSRIGSRGFAGKVLPPAVVPGTIGEVLDDPEVDLVVVATPNDSHAELGLLALQAGKHVVIDKPFALTADQARPLVALAHARDLVLSVFQNRRWDGGFLSVRRALEDALLGEVDYAALHFDRFSPTVKDRWRERSGPGAGLLYDLGPHLIDQALCLFGMPDAVTATLAQQRPGAQVDDFFHIVLEQGARRVVLHASCLMPADHAPRISVYGQQGCLTQRGFDGQEDALKAGAGPGDAAWGTTPGGEVWLTTPDGKRRALPFLDGCYQAYYAGIADAILDGSAPPVTGSEAMQVMTLLDAARRSVSEGRRIAVQ